MRVGVVAAAYGRPWDERSLIARRLAGALACTADVDVLVPEGASKAEELDGAVRVMRFPATPPDRRFAAAWRRVAIGPETTDHDPVRCSCLSPRRRRESLPAFVEEQLLLAEGGDSPELYSHLQATPYDLVVLVGLHSPAAYWGAQSIPDDRRLVVVPALSDEALIGLQLHSATVERADRIITFTNGEYLTWTKRLGAGARKVENIGFPVGVNPVARETDSADVKSGPFVILADDWTRRTPPTRLTRWAERLTLDVHPEVSLRIVGPGAERSPLGIPGTASRLDMWRWVSRAVALFDPAPRRLLGLRVVEALLYETPVIVHARGGANREHAERGGGLWFRTDDEFCAMVRVLFDVDLARVLGEQGRSYAEDHYGDVDGFITRVGATFLSEGGDRTMSPPPPSGRERLDSSSRLLIRAIAEVAQALPDEDEPILASPPPPYGLDALHDPKMYPDWLSLTKEQREAQRRRTREALKSRSNLPTLSVVLPVYRPDLALLERCVGSVLRQDYEGWQLCVCDDASGDPQTEDYLKQRHAADARIAVTVRSENGGISMATNTAAELATGDFLAFLDQDDELEPGALAEVALTLADDDDIDVLYTDQDKLEPDGTLSEPFFKPDWSPDQLLSQMYLGHLLVVRRSLFFELGGLRPEYDGSQDYDLALRATERARKVGHVPVVAYHWRKIPGSTAHDYRAKPHADSAARAALAEALTRRGDEGVVEPGLHDGTFRIRRAIRGEPLVSVIIPFHDGGELLRRCVTSLQEHSGYENWEALLVDNLSWEPETRAVLNRLTEDHRCRVLPYPQPFNWATLNNFAVRHVSGEHLLFLNADIEGTSDDWLRAMLEHSQRPEVGPVGARLLYPDGSVQHAGVIMGLGGGIAWHAFCFCPGHWPGYFGQAKLIRNYSAVTGACMMVKQALFKKFDGFDERLAVAYNDVDFCLRLSEAGYRSVYTPFAELTHEESAARGRAAPATSETALMLERWEAVIRRDPYFNPNLDRLRSAFALPTSLDHEDRL